MRSKTALLLLLLSLSLNIAFIAVWAVRTLPAEKSSTRCPCPSDSTCGVWCPLHRSLGTTEEQWRALEPLQMEFQSRSRALQDSINALRISLVDLMSAADPDSIAIQCTLDEMLAIQRRVQNHVVNHLLTERQVLTPEQQSRLFDMMRDNRGCANRGLLLGQSHAGHGSKNCNP